MYTNTHGEGVQIIGRDVRIKMNIIIIFNIPQTVYLNEVRKENGQSQFKPSGADKNLDFEISGNLQKINKYLKKLSLQMLVKFCKIL